jgi:predicted NBD/HSP70 family sugar kinase
MSTQRFRSRKHETAASNKTPRQINRNLIFHLVRTKQPVSRADLSRLTGLQRGAISLIGKLPRGRNPTFLGLNRSRAILAVDIHPTQTTIAVTDIEGRIISQQVLMLSQDANKALQAIVGAIRKTQPGRTDLNSNNLIFAPNLKWPVLALKQKMERATRLRVKMDNVVNACALSEIWLQSRDGQHDLVVVNVSEGIGTGIFMNGKLLRRERHGWRVRPYSDQAGRTTVRLRESGLLGDAGIESRCSLILHEVCNPRTPLTFETLVKMSRSGDQPTTHALTRMAEYLGRGIRIISVALAPKEIVVVGEITAAWHTFGSIIEDELKKNTFTKVPILRPAYDGNTDACGAPSHSIERRSRVA